MEPSLERTRRIDHPVAMLVIVLIVIGAISGYATLQILGRDTTSACDQSLGRIRIHMATNAPPNAMDTESWDEVTAMYEDVNSSCPETVAEPFRAGDFAVWTAPALQFGGSFFGEDTGTGDAPAGGAPTDVPATDVPATDAPAIGD